MGFDIIQYPERLDNLMFWPPDFDETAREIISAVNTFTMTKRERLFALIEAVRYIHKAQITGAFVECGVWRGGSMMAAAKTLISMKVNDRDLYLFDTFEGMTKPSDADVSVGGHRAIEKFERTKLTEETSDWCRASIEDVETNMRSTGYDLNRIHLRKGRVEDTIPTNAPTRIALLRLDTDWYESTRHELVHLYPRLTPGGVLIIDDYGHWKGCRQACDEFFQDKPVLLNRIDYLGRIAVKLN